MKKIISFMLAAVMLVSAVPAAYATNDYTQGTQVVFEATGTETYTITVPAMLAPGGSGTVTLEGTWADNRIITVSAEPTVTLTNGIKTADQKVLTVHFDGISEAGSNISSQKFTEAVSVDNITNALFGTWSGKFNYNVDVSDNVLKGNTIVVFGSSISSGLSGVDNTYIENVANNNEMILKNFALPNGSLTNSIEKYESNLDIIENLTSKDYVIIEGFYNSFSILTGELTPDGTTVFDTTTFIGALENFVYQYKTSGYKAKLCFVLANNTTNPTLSPLVGPKWDAAISVLEKYDVPYIDLRNTNYELGDGLHPSNNGHIAIAKDVERWLRTQ